MAECLEAHLVAPEFKLTGHAVLKLASDSWAETTREEDTL